MGVFDHRESKLKFKLIFVLLFMLPCLVFGKVSPAGSFDIEELKDLEEMKELEDIDKEVLSELTEEEQEIQQELFILSREIEMLQNEQVSIEKEIETISEELEQARTRREEHEEKLEELEERLREVFRSFQRRGPLSYFEIILGAEDLRDFLQRANIIKDVFSNINELFSSYIDERSQLASVENDITQELLNLYELEKRLEENIEKAYDKKEEQQDLLDSVQAELHDYEEQMKNIEKMWINQTRPFLAELAGALDRLIEEDKLDRDKIYIGGTFFNPEAVITEENFNSFFEEVEELPVLLFQFKSDEVFLELPGGNLTFKGNIVPVGDTRLSFEIEEASFFDIYLGEEVIGELTQDIELSFDFAAEMENYRIEEIAVREGRLVLDIRADYF